jgi:hydroxylamine reductase (hybrid-cluster protein)
VLDVLVKNFDLKPNTTVETDMARMVASRYGSAGASIIDL